MHFTSWSWQGKFIWTDPWPLDFHTFDVHFRQLHTSQCNTIYLHPKQLLDQAKEDICYKRAKYTGKGDPSCKEDSFWKAKDPVLFQWHGFSVERSERQHQLQNTIPQHWVESTTGRQSEWVLLQVLKNTINTSNNPSCTSDQWRWHVTGLKKEQEKKSTRPRWCHTSLSENLCWPAGPHLHTDLQQMTGAVRSPFLLQTLHQNPHPKETQNYWT